MPRTYRRKSLMTVSEQHCPHSSKGSNPCDSDFCSAFHPANQFTSNLTKELLKELPVSNSCHLSTYFSHILTNTRKKYTRITNTEFFLCSSDETLIEVMTYVKLCQIFFVVAAFCNFVTFCHTPQRIH